MKFNIKDLKVGQIVFVRPIGNYARGIKNSEVLDHIKEAEVIKVGHKYLYLKGYDRHKFGFRYDDSNECVNITEYSADFEIYLAKQDIINELEQDSLTNFLQDFFRWSSSKSKKLTLEQMRKIKTIIDSVK